MHLVPPASAAGAAPPGPFPPMVSDEMEIGVIPDMDEGGEVLRVTLLTQDEIICLNSTLVQCGIVFLCESEALQLLNLLTVALMRIDRLGEPAPVAA